jgi:hypothetical protein
VSETEWLAQLVALTITVAFSGTTFGAVYKPLVEIVPNCELPPSILLTDHVTFLFTAPVTSALSCSVLPTLTVAVSGETVTLTAAAPALMAGANAFSSNPNKTNPADALNRKIFIINYFPQKKSFRRMIKPPPFEEM